MLVPRIEALVLPIGVERATQKPHAEYAIQTQHNAHALCCIRILHIHKASIVASFLTPIEIYQIPMRQESNVDKRLQNICIPPHKPRPRLLRGGLHRKFNNFILYLQLNELILQDNCIKIGIIEQVCQIAT